VQKVPYQPQLPRPVAVVTGSTWADIWKGIATLSKQNQNLVQYLQNYLTQLFKWLVPTKFAVNIVATLPYTVNETDTVVAGPAGTYTLPASSGSGRVIIGKNLDTAGGTMVWLPNGTDTIDGGAEIDITIANDTVWFLDGAVGQWLII
jgi:hypothetical protein